MRKRHGRSHALWLIDGIVRPLKPFGKGRYSHPAVHSTRTDDPDAGGNACAQCYSRGQAEHLGIPVMPRNPFRDEMSRR